MRSMHYFFQNTYYIQVSTFPLSFEDTFERGFAHDTNFFSLYQCIIFSPLIDGHLWHQYVCPLGMERNRIQFAIKMFGRTLLLQQCNLSYIILQLTLLVYHITKAYSTHPFLWENGLLSAKRASNCQTLWWQIGPKATQAESVETRQDLKNKKTG